MPTVSPHDKILVTGANGYIGPWVVRRLLQSGYLVRAAVRTDEKGALLLKLFQEKLPEKAQNLEYVLVPDIVVEHAYDEAIQGVAGVVHIASPLTIIVDDPQKLIKPAVGGALSLLKSALEHGKNLKRIVMTSSVMALLGNTPGTYTEEHWAEWAVQEVEAKGKETPAHVGYSASKVLAERAAFSFYEEHKSTVPWDLTTINCGWCFGPTFSDPAAPYLLPSTAVIPYIQIFNVREEALVFPQPGCNYIDVRDAGEVHARALEVPEAGGERLIGVSQWCNWQHWLNAAAELNLLSGLDKWDPARAERAPECRRVCAAEKATRVLGVQMRTVRESLRDTVEEYIRHGWITEEGQLTAPLHEALKAQLDAARASGL